ncbi:hypothetical protein [uncultured Desulfuromonas sp.]|uniref:hypothetical protein n=1 Tax=uncultured Desulfuromonas sp. TaxID=181013 RepID=UPI002AAA6D51|nr:hypothetical protein [uncultured Desulfuromonas sp.]
MKPSTLGHGNVISSLEKGAFVDHIELTAAISLSRLSRYKFLDDNGKDSEERNAAAREVLVQLALLGVARVMDRLDLRSGCELYTSGREASRISADGTRTTIQLPSGTKEVKGAINAAAKQGLAFAGPLTLMAGNALERLAAKGGV